MRAEHGSYFLTMLNRTKHEIKRKEKKRSMRNITNIAARLYTHVILSLKEKVLGLNSKNKMN